MVLGKRKRRRSSLHTPADHRHISKDIALDVDLLILDYLTYQALEDVLRLSKLPRTQSVRCKKDFQIRLQLVEAYVSHLQSIHTRRFLSLTRFKLALLRFCTLLQHASTPSPTSTSRTAVPSPTLTALRASNRARAARWWSLRRTSYSQASNTSLSSEAQEDIADTLAHLLQKSDRSGSSSTDEFNEGPDPTLLDILPLFIELTHDRARLSREGFVTREEWVQLAVEFMIQAFLEQRVKFNEEGCSSLLEAFAWGPIPAVTHDGNQVKDSSVHDIFLLPDPDSETDEETRDDVDEQETADIFNFHRDRAITALDPRTYASSQPRDLYRELLSEKRPIDPHPRPRFERDLWDFLGALAKSVNRPALVQLEEVQRGTRTRIDFAGKRFSNEETEHLRTIWERCIYDDTTMSR